MKSNDIKQDRLISMGSDIDVILEKLSPILQECFDDDGIIARPELQASDVEGWDSLAHVRLILCIERAFKIHFSASEVANFKNVGDLANAIRAKT